MKQGKWIILVFAAVLLASVAFSVMEQLHDTTNGRSLPRENRERRLWLTSWDYVFSDPQLAGSFRDGGEFPQFSEEEWKPMDALLNPEGRGESDVLWLRSRLPGKLVSNPFMVFQASQIFEIYIGSELIYQHGEINSHGTSHYIGTPPRIVPLSSEDSGKPIYIRIYSHGKDIGLLQEPLIASRSVIYMDIIRSQGIRFTLGCFYMFIGAIAFYPFLRFRQAFLLTFSGFAMFFGIYTASRTEIIYMLWDRPAFWMNVELASLLVSIAALVAFVEQIFGAGYKHYLNLLWKIHLLYGVVALPLLLIHVIEGSGFLLAYQMLLLTTIAIAVARIVRVAWRGDREARVILLGISVFSVCGAVDIVRQMVAVSSPLPDFAYWGAFIFLVSLILVIIRRLQEMLIRLFSSEKLTVAGQLAAGIAHEIRNPVTVISGYMQLLKKKSEHKGIIEIMQGEVTRIEYIVNEFLYLSKPSAPRMEDRNVEEIVRDVLRLFEVQAQEANVSIKKNFAKSLPRITCDGNQLKQVLVNVIKNALEAMPNGGSLDIRIETQAENVVVTVADTGCGIAKQEIERIGEPFFTTKKNGNGLGVMMCRRIIEAHKGKFIIHSVQGTGTTIEIYLPGKKKY